MTATILIAAARASYETPISGLVVLDVAILALLLAVAIAIIGQRSLFAVVMFSGVYSLLSAAFFTLMDAVDVSFTEAAVGAGISTVLMIGAMLLTARETRPTPPSRRWGPFIVVAGVGAALLYATADMPDFGDPESPANSYVGRAYLVRTPYEMGIPNVVTVVLASYRGYDTFGETVVIFTAGLGVMLLLGLRSGGPASTPQDRAVRRWVQEGDEG
jgi:multicomponent Na+:H+ antiporter subunit B